MQADIIFIKIQGQQSTPWSANQISDSAKEKPAEKRAVSVDAVAEWSNAATLQGALTQVNNAGSNPVGIFFGAVSGEVNPVSAVLNGVRFPAAPLQPLSSSIVVHNLWITIESTNIKVIHLILRVQTLEQENPTFIFFGTNKKISVVDIK